MNTHTIYKTTIEETLTISETSGRIDIKQNRRYFQIEIKKANLSWRLLLNKNYL
ncbi:hypothetical protein [Schinkia azotoformans]|uniref:hypothetical protein n=1 Tax=Schinkia azotoformans TaxID=1454 RepID=UPI002DBA9045|nr:hypothetical protein [Schinkia azotoformans]MEC1721717.1 hypothetical protein [Schinkia azotoformans]